MTRKKEIMTAVGTLGCAVGIGFIMQSSETAAKRYNAEAVAPAAKEIKASSALLTVESVTLTAAEFETNLDLPIVDTEVATAAAPESVLPEPEVPTASPEPVCEMTANARPVAAAMVNVTLDAACQPNERVTIHHNGMIFTQVTSDTGQMDITMPALIKDAVIIMAFSSGEGVLAQTTVEEITDFNRVAVQWKGQSGLEIHAREFGAAYGEQGHIWKDAPGDVVDAVTGQGGFLSRLGDPDGPEPLMAEVYSFPAVATEQAGEIALSVETQISSMNCGLEIEAQTLTVGDDGKLQTQNLTLSMPECDAIGDFLVLNNLFQDMKVAAR